MDFLLHSFSSIPPITRLLRLVTTTRITNVHVAATQTAAKDLNSVVMLMAHATLAELALAPIPTS